VPVDHHEVAARLERTITLLRLLRNPTGEMSLSAASTLSRLATTGPRRLSDLAAREGVTQPAMTQLVSKLERQRLVERRRPPEDRRVVLVEITATGRRLIGDVRARRAVELSELLTALPEEDERAVAAALPALSRLIELIAPHLEEGYPLMHLPSPKLAAPPHTQRQSPRAPYPGGAP
jgi:DNA-binding MarR family transcriptional regulator